MNLDLTKEVWGFSEPIFDNYHTILSTKKDNSDIITVATISFGSSDVSKNDQESICRIFANSPNMLRSIIELQEKLEVLINATPSGDKRNELTDLNIKTLDLIQRITK